MTQPLNFFRCLPRQYAYALIAALLVGVYFFVAQKLKVIPATTTSVLEPGKKYKDYSFDELRKLQKKMM